MAVQLPYHAENLLVSTRTHVEQPNSTMIDDNKMGIQGSLNAA